MMYKLINSDSKQQFVVRILDNTWIPFDEANTDYQEYLKWLAEGNIPESAE